MASGLRKHAPSAATPPSSAATTTTTSTTSSRPARSTDATLVIFLSALVRTLESKIAIQILTLEIQKHARNTKTTAATRQRTGTLNTERNSWKLTEAALLSLRTKLKHHPARISSSVEQEEDRPRFTPPAENGAIRTDAMIKLSKIRDQICRSNAFLARPKWISSETSLPETICASKTDSEKNTSSHVTQMSAVDEFHFARTISKSTGFRMDDKF